MLYCHCYCGLTVIITLWYNYCIEYIFYCIFYVEVIVTNKLDDEDTTNKESVKSSETKLKSLEKT